MFYNTALFGAVPRSLTLPVLAQSADDDANALDTVVIEGSRLGQTKTEIGSAVSIITADDIEELGFDYALDAVAAAPGVTVNQNGSFGGQASVRIRGAASEQTLVLIDGVPVNDPSSPGGGFNFARVDTANIERIEVLKGAQSTLWGTDAIGGVVSITTKTPEGGFGGSAFAEYGSFNAIRGGASIENGNEQGDFRLALTGTSTDGISRADENDGNTEDDGYEALTFSAKGGLNFGSDARLSADVSWTDAEAEIDGFAPGFTDTDETSETEEFSGNISLTGSLFDGRLENLLPVGYSEIDRENFNSGVSSFSADGERTIYRYQGTLNIDDQNTLAFGADRDESVARGQETTIDGLFALYEYQPIESLTLTGGLRMDDHSTFGSETTGRVAAAYNPTSQLTFRASWGQGFKAPTIFQLTGGGFVDPNPNLQPETSETIDAGVDWRSKDGRTEASVTIFDTDIENLIQFTSMGYMNEAQVETKGVELAGRYELLDWLSVSASYAYIDATDTDGDPLIRVPEHSGDVTFSIDPDGPFSGAVLVRYNDVEPDRFGAKVDDWTRVDLNGAYQVSEKVEVFGRIENIFEEEYQQIRRYGTPYLSGSVGIRLRY